MDADTLKGILVNEIMALQRSLSENFGFEPIYRVVDLLTLDVSELRSIKMDLRDMRRTLQ